MQFKLTLFSLDNVECNKSTLLWGMGKKSCYGGVYECAFWPGFYLPERGGAIFPRTVYPGMSLSLLPKQRIFTSLGVWFGKLLLRYFK